MNRRGITIEFAFDPEHDQITSPEAQAERAAWAADLGKRLGRALECHILDEIFGPPAGNEFAIGRVAWGEFHHNDATAGERATLGPSSHGPCPAPAPPQGEPSGPG